MLEDNIINKAKSLRKNMTRQERHLWYDFLKSRPEKWYKQKIIGKYIVDFYCDSFKLVIELDGGQHYDKKAIEYDAERTRYLEGLGNRVIRFTNTEVDYYFKSVCDKIVMSIKEKSGAFINRGW